MGNSLIKQVNPALTSLQTPEKKEVLRAHRDLLRDKPWNGVRITLITPDMDTIDAMLFPGKLQGKALIFAKGSGGYYEEIPETPSFIEFIRKEVGDIDLLFVNNRGVAESQGVQSIRKVALDIFSGAQFLIETRKIDPNRVLIYGHSFGGMVGIFAARLLEQQYPEKSASVIVDRAFLNLAQLAGNSLGGGIVGSIVEKLFTLGGWDTIGCLEAFQLLKGKKIVIYSPQDKTIPHDFSFGKYALSLPKESNITFMKLGDASEKMTHLVGCENIPDHETAKT